MVLSRNFDIFVSALDNQQSQIVFTKTEVFITFVWNHTLPLMCDYKVVEMGITHSIYIPLTLIFLMFHRQWTNSGMVRIRRPAVLNLRNVTIGDVSVLWAVLNICKTSSLKIRQEFSAKQSMSPKGQPLLREQLDEAASCVRNIE